jgi:hypothetical protein
VLAKSSSIITSNKMVRLQKTPLYETWMSQNNSTGDCGTYGACWIEAGYANKGSDEFFSGPMCDHVHAGAIMNTTQQPCRAVITATLVSAFTRQALQHGL